MKDKRGIVNIHGKEYMTVARRVELAHEDGKFQGVKSNVISHDPVVIQVTVNIAGVEYQGTSAANPMKSIEKTSPYEVAETSALGRALGFAGYGIVDGIASADEMYKVSPDPIPQDEEYLNEAYEERSYPEQKREAVIDKKVCSAHETPIVMFRGVSKSKFDKEGNPKTYYWHKGINGEMCFGNGYTI